MRVRTLSTVPERPMLLAPIDPLERTSYCSWRSGPIGCKAHTCAQGPTTHLLLFQGSLQVCHLGTGLCDLLHAVLQTPNGSAQLLPRQQPNEARESE
jgi:hypothetical protein